MSRREVLRGLGIVSLFALASCTPVKYVLNSHPSKYNDKGTLDSILCAFVITVLPGAPIDDPNLVRIYTDDYYPFAEYASFFANDLDSRASDLYKKSFVALAAEQRTVVIQDGLQADKTMVRLYKAAIYMAKVSFFAGIYDPSNGCPTIEFYGENNGFDPDEMYYRDAKRFMAREITHTGNYN